MIGACIIALGTMVSAWLDIKKKVKSPVIYYLIGALSIILADMIDK